MLSAGDIYIIDIMVPALMKVSVHLARQTKN